MASPYVATIAGQLAQRADWPAPARWRRDRVGGCSQPGGRESPARSVAASVGGYHRAGRGSGGRGGSGGGPGR